MIPFSIDYIGNQSSVYSSYFVKPASPEFHIHKISKFSITAIKTGIDLVYNISAYRNLNKLINDVKPDTAYILLFSKLSISILKSLKRNNIPIILRISDFIYFCSRGVLMMNGAICEKCLGCSFHRILNKCTNESYLFSAIDYFRRIIEKKSGYLKYIDELIIPSIFTSNFYQKHRYFPNAKITHIPTFFDKNPASAIYNEIDFIHRFSIKTITVFGRVSKEKGIEILLQALTQLYNENLKDLTINIIGFTNSEYSIALKKIIAESETPNIHCYEFLEANALNEILERSTITVIPSICYDNMPNSLIESQAIGLPVIASNIGSFPELITDGYNGYLFGTNNSSDLAGTIKKALMTNKEKYIEMCHNSIDWANKYCSKEMHYNKLMSVFNNYKK